MIVGVAVGGYAVVQALGAGGGSGTATVRTAPPDTTGGLRVSVPGVAEPGAPAPPFDVPALRGPGRVTLAEHRGQPLMVNFWASWCIPCRKEFPMLKAAYDRHQAEGLALVGITFRDLPGDARSFARKERADWPLGYDADQTVARAYGVRAVPQTFLIRPDGTIAQRWYGAPTAAALEQSLQDLLAPSR